MSVRGLRKNIYPFAPDQSGAVSVLYDLGGMVIICDAGGCAGNVCGFDEPRWLGKKSAVFSAGLRDMDAILGRDDLLIEKITDASSRLDAKFIAIIGTPVPATIATDYRALKRMAEKKTGLPVITVDSNGAKLYDEGEKKAYLELFRKFALDTDSDNNAVIPGSAGVIGLTPLDADGPYDSDRMKEALACRGITRAVCYGADSTLEDISSAGRMEKNIAVSAAGIRAARYLKERFGTPYEAYDPLAGEALSKAVSNIETELGGKKILIIHQQVRANTLRNIIRACTEAEIDTATWFILDSEIKEPGDIRIAEEEDFFNLIRNGGYDIIIADGSFRRAAKSFTGRFIEMPHFAVSGEYRNL